jgi:hypothetical protein
MGVDEAGTISCPVAVPCSSGVVQCRLLSWHHRIFCLLRSSGCAAPSFLRFLPSPFPWNMGLHLEDFNFRSQKMQFYKDWHDSCQAVGEWRSRAEHVGWSIRQAASLLCNCTFLHNADFFLKIHAQWISVNKLVPQRRRRSPSHQLWSCVRRVTTECIIHNWRQPFWNFAK